VLKEAFEIRSVFVVIVVTLSPRDEEVQEKKEEDMVPLCDLTYVHRNAIMTSKTLYHVMNVNERRARVFTKPKGQDVG
jgi:hypothetical protein